MGYIIPMLIYGLTFGAVTNLVIHCKGYQENWFWWGFFFGILAAIFACIKPQKRFCSERQEPSWHSNREILEAGGWECPCGRINVYYVNTCLCGRTRCITGRKNQPIIDEIQIGEGPDVSARKIV